jgi:hypothetical protein
MNDFTQYLLSVGITDPETQAELTAQLKFSSFEIALEQIAGDLNQAEKFIAQRSLAARQADDAVVQQIFHSDERQKILLAATDRARAIMDEVIRSQGPA